MIIIMMWPLRLAGWDFLSPDLLNVEVYLCENLTKSIRDRRELSINATS